MLTGRTFSTSVKHLKSFQIFFFLCKISGSGKVVPKFYPSEGQPRSTSDEFPPAVLLTQFLNEQSRHVDKLDKYVLIYLACKQKYL